ncbi:MAG: helix-turn-helix domain-containing protein [Marinosulfonomonas sp.]|nr:helix-turn-helix domain-containing protein [Marinosulfonomonas sp.]
MATENRQGVLSDWIKRDELARQLSVTTDTLARWATQGIGPPRIRIGRRVLYRRTSVEKWLTEMERKSACR